ncbi:unnamed protein product [Gordionus sp. m RMFG-2023]
MTTGNSSSTTDAGGHQTTNIAKGKVKYKPKIDSYASLNFNSNNNNDRNTISGHLGQTGDNPNFQDENGEEFEGIINQINGPLNGNEPIDDADNEQELNLKYGAKHVISTFKPVVYCMLLVVISLSWLPYYKIQDNYMIYTPFHEKTNDIGTKVWQSVANSAIFISVIIAVTCLFVFLYKYRCMKIITGWLLFASVILMFVYFGIHLEQIFSTLNLPLDYVTASLVIFNYAILGLLVVHWKGPLRLHQAYLIINSSLFALTLIKYLPDWTTWVLLAFLSIWDMVAVLCPKGPLRALVETAQERNDYFPSIIYSSTMVWMMTSKEGKTSQNNLVSTSGSRNSYQLFTGEVEAALNNQENTTVDILVASVSDNNNDLINVDHNYDNVETVVVRRPLQKKVVNKWNPENEDDRGVKIGLGDLVFYSVLVGKASSYGDWNTTITCFIAILIGLCLTLILLAIFKMPLPALPISIFFGLIFYFSTSTIITPFLDALSKDNLFI